MGILDSLLQWAQPKPKEEAASKQAEVEWEPLGQSTTEAEWEPFGGGGGGGTPGQPYPPGQPPPGQPCYYLPPAAVPPTLYVTPPQSGYPWPVPPAPGTPIPPVVQQPSGPPGPPVSGLPVETGTIMIIGSFVTPPEGSPPGTVVLKGEYQLF